MGVIKEAIYLSQIIREWVFSQKMEVIPNPSPSTAKDLDSQGRYLESLRHYYSLAETASYPEQQSNFLIEAAQQSINTGLYNLAGRLIDQAESIATPTHNDLVMARVWEKRAWLFDYAGNSDAEIEYLKKAKDLAQKGQIDNPIRGKILATCTHFLGRAYFSQNKVAQAEEQFQADLQLDASPNVQGFDHAWLCRCRLKVGDLSKAQEELLLAKDLFEQHIKTHPDSPILAHYYRLQAQIDIATARQNYEQAYTLEQHKYPRGATLDLLGIAGTHLAEGNLGGSITYIGTAVKTLLKLD